MANLIERIILENALPVLRKIQYRITSPMDNLYNCIAWAAGDSTHWWEPSLPMPLAGYRFYWPPGLPLVYTLENYVKAFESQGFSQCGDPTLEDGIEKVALYVYPGEATCSHAARQLPSGTWVSKCGKLQDIEHATPQDIGGGRGHGYGEVARYMRRLRPSTS